MPTAAEAQAINQAWNLAQSTGTPFVSPVSASEDAFREEMKRQIAFSQPRDDTMVATSPEFQRIQQQYAQQRYATVGSGGTYQQSIQYQYVPENLQFSKDAAGIAAEVFLRGGRGAVDYNLAVEAVRPADIAHGEYYKNQIAPQFVTLAGVNELGQRVNIGAVDYAVGNRTIGGVGVIGVDTGVHTQRGDWGPAVIGTSEMQRQSTFIEATNRGIRMADQINRVNEMLSTPPPSKEMVVQPSTVSSPTGTFGENLDFIGMLGLGGSAAGQRAFQNATMGRHPGAEYYGLPPGAVEATGRIRGERTLASVATTSVLPISGSGVEAWAKQKEGVASREPMDTRTSFRPRPFTDLESIAVTRAETRPGYTAPETIGDKSTRDIMGGFESLRIAGAPMPSRDALLGVTVEAQRQKAAYTPGVRDDLYYSGELQKWAQNKVELASSYHALGMQQERPIPANRFEYTADLAVEFLKGEPKKPSEVFSPVSGEMGKVLPGGKGLQDMAWETAITPTSGAKAPGAVSFAAGVEKLAGAEGKYGPYGALYGGPEFTAKEGRVNVVYPEERVLGSKPAEAMALPTPFRSTSAPAEKHPSGFVETMGRGVERLGKGWGAFDNMVRGKIPAPETLEPGFKLAALANPFTTPYVIAESIGGKSVVTDIAIAPTAGGQYKQFYESPLLYGVSLIPLGSIGGKPSSVIEASKKSLVEPLLLPEVESGYMRVGHLTRLTPEKLASMQEKGLAIPLYSRQEVQATALVLEDKTTLASRIMGKFKPSWGEEAKALYTGKKDSGFTLESYGEDLIIFDVPKTQSARAKGVDITQLTQAVEPKYVGNYVGKTTVENIKSGQILGGTTETIRSRGGVFALPFVAQGIVSDRITGSRVLASQSVEESKTPNFQEFVSGKRERYESELAAYEAAGSTDKTKYEDLLKQRSDLTRLTTIQYMTESTASINAQIREQDAARKSQQKQTTPDAALYNMIAPAGSQQRNIIEGVGKGIVSIPARLTEITGTDISGAVKAIQATAPKETIETTSREREFLTGVYGKIPGNEWLSKTGGFVTRAIGVSVKPEYQQVSPLGMVSGGGYAAESKILIPAAAAVVGGLVIQQSQRTGYDLSSYPGIQKAQELWEEHGQPIQAPGAWNLPKITDVVPAPVFEAPGEGYRQIVSLPGEGYGMVVNLPGEGRNLIAKVSEAVAVPAVPSVPSSGWGVTEIIRFPKPTIGPEDVISPTYDLSVKAQEKVTEVGRTLVTDRPIFDLSVDAKLKSAAEAKEAVVSQFAPDYATKLAQASVVATGVATTTPYWWTKTDYQSRLAEQDAIAFPEAYGFPSSVARPFATPTSIPQPLARVTDLPYAIPITYPTTPETPTDTTPDYSQGPGPKPPRWPEIKTIPGLPWLPDFGGASPTGGIRKGPRKTQVETSYIGPRMYRTTRGSLPRLPAKKPKTRSKKR